MRFHTGRILSGQVGTKLGRSMQIYCFGGMVPGSVIMDDQPNGARQHVVHIRFLHAKQWYRKSFISRSECCCGIRCPKVTRHGEHDRYHIRNAHTIRFTNTIIHIADSICDFLPAITVYLGRRPHSKQSSFHIHPHGKCNTKPSWVIVEKNVTSIYPAKNAAPRKKVPTTSQTGNNLSTAHRNKAISRSNAAYQSPTKDKKDVASCTIFANPGVTSHHNCEKNKPRRNR